MIKISKLRPANFHDLVGHERKVDLIKNALKFGFPEFVIFSGVEGIGKSTLSYICAKHLLCPNAINGLACDECETCKEITQKVIYENKSIDDVRIFRMSDEGGKRAARKIEEFIKQLPQRGNTKVIILEELQGISTEAQDLLLPVLEYIPADTKIIGNTTNLNSLQRTFLSRANHIALSIPAKKDVTQLLESICQRESISIIGNSVIPRIVEYADGKPRKAIKTLQTLACQSNEINIALVNEFLSLIDEAYYLEYLRILRGDLGLILDFTETLTQAEISLTAFVKGLNDFLVKLITLRYRSIYLPESIMKKAKEFLNSIDELDLLKIQSIVCENAPNILTEEYAKPQFIAMSFKLINRNLDKKTLETMKSPLQVEREKELAMRNHIKRTKEKEQQAQLKTMDLSNNVNALLSGMNVSKISTPETE